MKNKVQIIAEAGINFSGDITLGKILIERAKECGADVFKTQVYDPEKLLDRSVFSDKDWAFILKSKLTFEQTKELKEYCDKIGIEFMASAFDVERLTWLEELGVLRHKIASRSIYDVDYVEAVKNIGKPYLVSMGYLSKNNPLNETCSDTWKRLDHSNSKVDFLYCVSKYPTRLQDIFLSLDTFDIDWYDGFSDHSQGLTASKVAISLGATIIEKHFTLHSNLGGPDQICSMIPAELKELCKFRDEYQLIGEE